VGILDIVAELFNRILMRSLTNEIKKYSSNPFAIVWQWSWIMGKFEISAKGVFELTQNHHSVMDVIIVFLCLLSITLNR